MSTLRLGAEGDLWISPKYSVSCWHDLHAGSSDFDWEKAVRIFHDRMHGRFLAPVDAMQNHADNDIQEFCGFTVVAIDCLLIETLGQFYGGLDTTPKPHRIHYPKIIENIGRLSGVGGFDTEDKRRLFYDHFRCGILHQSQTKMNSRIRFGEKQMVQLANPDALDQGLIVDRKLLHDALVDEITAYEGALKLGNDPARRSNFIKKMGFIAQSSVRVA